mmetsp:Transcript_105657/g.187887  ORF Transcript_105657/g.187887 Transcript_105657/m.187887 type:complete len:146 (-) Transcript_105657:60-497(-)
MFMSKGLVTGFRSAQRLGSALTRALPVQSLQSQAWPSQARFASFGLFGSGHRMGTALGSLSMRTSPSPSSVSPLLENAGSRRMVCTKQRNRFKMDKHQYLKNVKRVRYISAIPQYTGPLGRQTKKRAIIKDYRQTPRLRVFRRER